MILFLLFATGLFAGTVDAIAGGGGLISLPILLSIGMPPHLAFGTNKLQSTIGTLKATLKYYKHGYISLEKIYVGICFGAVGSILGSITAQIIHGDILSKIIPIFLFAILMYTIFSPHLGQHDKQAKMKEFWFYLIFGFTLAFYDGFFGPGTAMFWVFAYTFFLGYNLIKATAYSKVFNLNSNIISTICFAIGGNIDYRFGLVMALGQLIGGHLGAHLAITKGAQLIRPIFLSVVSLTIVTLVYKSYAGSNLIARITKHYGLVPHIALAMIILLSILFVFIRHQRNAARKA
jgi:uncharacterized membrane protein YfcA